MDIQNGCKMAYFKDMSIGQISEQHLEGVAFEGCTFEKPLNEGRISFYNVNFINCTFEKPLNGDHLSFYNVKFINCGSIPVQNWNTLHLDGCEFENTSTSVSGVGVVGLSLE
jgi:hypothetical protein